MSLATLRAHIWKGGNDVMLYYKSNGRKTFSADKKVEATPAEEEESVPAAPAAVAA